MKKKKIIALIIFILVVIVGIGLYFILKKDDIKEIVVASDNLILIEAGTFDMGSPESEYQRGKDETSHKVTVDSFYISATEVTQKDYENIMGENPSNFKGQNLPVENVTWYDALKYCNKLSEKEGLTPVYTIDGENVSWNRSANGYRLPTEAEWEYVARAGTTTPFNTENSISAEEANYYGHYPYGIEENYFDQEKLETKPGEYRETTIEVGSFKPNKWGLYDIHGNVREWCFDYYGEYDLENTENPSGPTSGTLRVTRGGGWNDYAKHMRSAYRSSEVPTHSASNTGFRIVRNSEETNTSVISSNNGNIKVPSNAKVLIAYFSWGGNTEGVAEEIKSQINADLFELKLENPYSSDYNTVLDEAQKDLNSNARPKLANHVDNIDEYDVIMIGYPNWWATIPMPVASFLEEYNFNNKIIIPFCSHGGGGLGQSITDISKIVPNSTLGEPLSIHYSGGKTLSQDVSSWLDKNGINKN